MTKTENSLKILKPKLNLKEIEKVIENDSNKRLIELYAWLYKTHLEVLREYEKDVLKSKFKMEFLE